MKLSIVIPVYNEEKTIAEVLRQVIDVNLGDVQKEIIVVDDGSKDNTVKKVEDSITGKRGIIFFKHEKNQGKGAAVRTGFGRVTGDYIIIQDADLEYDPHQIPMLLKPILQKRSDIVFGTRLKRLPDFSRDERTFRFFIQYLGNKFLSLVTSILYLRWVTDMETCYKIFPKKAVEGMRLHARSFDFEPEITAKLLKKGYRFFEIPISTNPRGYEEGKKLNAFRDGPVALWTLVKYRFVD